MRDGLFCTNWFGNMNCKRVTSMRKYAFFEGFLSKILLIPIKPPKRKSGKASRLLGFRLRGKDNNLLAQSSKIFVTICALSFAIPSTSFSQDADGGVESLFSYGVGARALGLGGAYTAVATDASTVYWNPAGLDLLPQQSAVMFYSRLPFGSQYNAISVAYPTLNLGAVGLAVLRISSDYEVRGNEAFGEDGAEGSFAQTEFILSYGKKVLFDFAFGASVKLDQKDFEGLIGRGVGLDLGLNYSSSAVSGLLQNTAIGLTIQNAIEPILKVNNEGVPLPRNIKVGLAKKLSFGLEENALSFMADVSMGEGKTPKYHAGMEFLFKGGAMARIGLNDKAPAFGAGAKFNVFQIDYSYGWFAEQTPDFGASQRLSVTIEFGKTRQDIVAEQNRKRAQEVNDRVAREIQAKRRLDVQNLIDAGNALLRQGKFYPAFLRFSEAKLIEPNNQAATVGANRAQQKIDEIQSREEEQRKQTALAEQERIRKEQFVQRQLQRGIDQAEAGRLERAIAEWELALEEDPENQVLKDWINKTGAEIGNRTATRIRNAERFAANGNYLKAIETLTPLQNSNSLDEDTRRRVNNSITIWNNRLSGDSAWRQGLNEYYNGNYVVALRYFEQARKSEPGNRQYQEFRDRAEERANARDEDFASQDIRKKYQRALGLVSLQNYQEALNILNEIRKQQKYNKRILDLIDKAEQGLRSKN